MFKIKSTDIAGNVFVHVSINFILFSKGLQWNF